MVVVVASAGFVVGDDVGLSDGLGVAVAVGDDVGLNVAVTVGVVVGVVVEAALVGLVVVVAGTLVVGTLVVGVPVVGTPVVGFLVVGYALGARLPTNGAGGAPQSLEILTIESEYLFRNRLEVVGVGPKVADTNLALWVDGKLT